jgi:hypothetical protein
VYCRPFGNCTTAEILYPRRKRINSLSRFVIFVANRLAVPPLFYSHFPIPYSLLLHERLQDERGGHLIHNAPMLVAGVAGFVQNLMGLAGGKPLVPEMDRQAGQRAQFGGESLGFGGLGTYVAGEMDGIAYHDAHDIEAPRQPRQRAQVFALVVTPLERQYRLGGQPQFVGHGHADAAIANIEAEVAGMRGGFQLLAPGF